MFAFLIVWIDTGRRQELALNKAPFMAVIVSEELHGIEQIAAELQHFHP